jgi:formate-dependent nitrite reductase membrane component NrfD
MVPLPGASAWAQPVIYPLPSRCTYSGRLYELRIAHTSQAVWTPPAVPALWLDIGPAAGVAAYTRAAFWVVGSDEPDYTQVERAHEV